MPFIDHLSWGAQAVFLLVFALVAYFGFLRSGLSLAPWVPTKKADLERVADLVALQPGECCLEAGCGDARVMLYLARRFPDCTFVGTELSVIMFAWAWIRVKCAGLKNTRIEFKDALEIDLHTYQVVYSYGLPKTINNKLLPKVKAELPIGGRFISYAFKIDAPENVTVHRSSTGSNIYVYEKNVTSG